MAKIYIYVISLVTAAAIYLITNSTTGIIIAASCAVAIAAIPFLIDIFKDKNTLSNMLATTMGIILALVGFGAVFPVLRGLPEFAQYGILGILVTLISYVFYRYQQEVGFNLVSGPGKPGEIIEPIGKIVTPKILDTSIVIDGRIIDLASTGFIEGPLIVPNFVLREIQLISDSADAIKRNRGRRGLDMLNTLQKRPDLEVKISYLDYTETREVDAKLIRLAKELKGKLITNDFNLNKVAELQDIDVLNINNLANALKPVVLPGEEMDVQVVKEGKDENQGIGYLDDGTMVVIENGGKMLGKRLRVNVTSVIQTNAGKMIFTKVIVKS
jgi:uncharacterized protein YacL